MLKIADFFGRVSDYSSTSTNASYDFVASLCAIFETFVFLMHPHPVFDATLKISARKICRLQVNVPRLP